MIQFCIVLTKQQLDPVGRMTSSYQTRIIRSKKEEDCLVSTDDPLLATIFIYSSSFNNVVLFLSFLFLFGGDGGSTQKGLLAFICFIAGQPMSFKLNKGIPVF